LNLWSNDTQGGSHRLGLWGHSDGEFFRKDGKKKRKSSKLLLEFLSDGRENQRRRKEFNDDS